MEDKILNTTSQDWLDMINLKDDSLIIKELQLRDIKRLYESEINKIPKWIRRLFGVQL